MDLSYGSQVAMSVAGLKILDTLEKIDSLCTKYDLDEDELISILESNDFEDIGGITNG